MLAIPRSLSQLTASFFGSQCQGIHPALLLAWPSFILVLNYASFSFEEFYCSILPHIISLCVVVILVCFPHCICFLALFNFQGSNLNFAFAKFWWAQVDSNHRPHAYQACALTTWAMRPFDYSAFHSKSFPYPWWRWGGSNSWPPACKAGALPAELHPHFVQGLGSPFVSLFLLSSFWSFLFGTFKIEQQHT